MDKTKQKSITRRSILSFCVLILIFFLFGLFLLYDINSVSSLTRMIYNHPLVVSNAALQSNASIIKMHRNMKDVVLFNSPIKIQKSIEAVNEEERKVYEHLDIIKDKIIGEEGRVLEQEARNLFREWRPIRKEVIGLIRENQIEKAADITIGKGAEHVVRLEKKMLGLMKYARKKASNFMHEAESEHSKLILTGILFLLLGVSASIMIALLTLKRTATAEKQIQESEERYRSLIENQTDFVCRFLPDGRFTFVNSVYCDFFKKTQDDLIGNKWHPLPVEEDLKLIEEKLSTLSPSNPTALIENRVYSGNGDIHWMQFINRGFFDDNGNLTEIQSVGRDITDRRNAEAETESATAFLDTVFDMSPFSMWISDREGIITRTNHSLRKTINLSDEEIVGRYNVLKDVNLENHGVMPMVMAVFKKQEPARFTIPWKAFDAEDVDFKGARDLYIDVSMFPIMSAEGELSNVVCQWVDITELKQAEKALLKSEDRFRSLFENAPLGYQSLDANGNFIEINETWCKVLGYAKEEVLGRNFSEFIHPDLQEVFKERFPKFKSMGYILGAEFEMIKKDGSEIVVSFDGKIGYYDDGSFKQTHCVLSDISESKRAADALLNSEKRYRSLFEESNDGIILHDLEGKIVDSNKKVQAMLGYTESELNELSIPMLHPESEFEASRRALEEIKDKGNVYFETKFIKKDGTIITVEISSSIVGDDKGLVQKIIRDVTERKKMEDQLRQAQKMESIGTLASGIAHDFNNILSPIIGFTELALGDIPEGKRAHENLEGVLTAANRAKDLVKQILTFSRQNEQEYKPMEAQIVVEEALKLLKSSIPKSIEISQKIDKNCGLITGDPTQIYQIVMNLCTNAYQAMIDSKGKLEVTLSEVRFDVEDIEDKIDLNPGRYLRLSVSDTGPGMTPDVIDRIFDPYYTTKEKGKGTGLGLFATLGVVKNHGGSISVYSEPGIGTTFHVYLPLLKKQIKQAETGTSQILETGSARILLVDDEESIIKMTHQMLERLGYQVTSRTSSIEALESFRAAHDDFDLVLSDMSMPNMNGLKLAGELLKIRSDIPIILCTGFSEGLTEERVSFFGIKGVLMKPVPFKDLSCMIRKVLDAGRSES